MKKSELKNIIKECVKEVIFEEGVLSGLITEVVHGLGTSSVVEPTPRKTESNRSQISETKKEVLSSIGKNAYDNIKNNFKNPELFEGTKPIPEGSGRGVLSGVDPGDSGVDISNIPGAGRWAQSAFATNNH